MRNRVITCHVVATALGTGLLALCCSGGCQPPESRKVLPTKVQVERPRSAEEQLAVPAVTPPDVHKYLERAVAALTQDKPNLLERARRSRAFGKGFMLLPDDAGQVAQRETLRDLAAEWPDRIRLHYHTQPPLNLQLTFLYLREQLWITRNRIPNQATEPAIIDEAPTDTLAQHWLPLLFPVLEPGTVAFDLRTSQGQPPRDLLRVKLPQRPLYQLGFDSRTRLLHHVEYRYQPPGTSRPLTREWIFEQHQSFDGLMLPTRLIYAEIVDHPRVREVKMEWTIERWEFPAEFPPDLFQPPKTDQQP